MLAAVAGAHGVRGEVRLKLFAQGLASLQRHRAVEVGGRALTLVSARPPAIARFAEVATREAAEALRGQELTVARAALPPPAEGEVYVADLVGLPALVAGVAVGRVVAVVDYGAGDLVEVERVEGGRALVPFARCGAAGPDGVEVDPLFLDA